MFDARVGLSIPGPDGQGVATLEEALADPAILERMDLPSQSPYFTSRASLLASPTKIGVLLDSSPGFFAPRMRLLQRELSGKNRTILYCDAALERDHFASVLGPWCGEVKLWPIPMSVINQLFTRPQFTESTKQTLLLFRPEFPLVFARIKQLRGELREAVEAYVSFRLIENLTQVDSKHKTVRKEIKDALDIYATNYLALCATGAQQPGSGQEDASEVGGDGTLGRAGSRKPAPEVLYVRLGCPRQPGPDLRVAGRLPLGHRALRSI